MTIWFDGLDDSETYINLESLSMKICRGKVTGSILMQMREATIFLIIIMAIIIPMRQDRKIIFLIWDMQRRERLTVRSDSGKAWTMTVDDISVCIVSQWKS